MAQASRADNRPMVAPTSPPDRRATVGSGRAIRLRGIANRVGSRSSARAFTPGEGLTISGSGPVARTALLGEAETTIEPVPRRGGFKTTSPGGPGGAGGGLTLTVVVRTMLVL